MLDHPSEASCPRALEVKTRSRCSGAPHGARAGGTLLNACFSGPFDCWGAATKLLARASNCSNGSPAAVIWRDEEEYTNSAD